MTDDIHHYTFTMPLAPWKVECPICGKVVNRDELEEHIRREHGEKAVHERNDCEDT